MACNGGGSFGGTRARCTPDSRSSRRQPAIWSGFRRRARRAGLSGRVASQTCPPRRTPRCWRPRRARTACTFCSPHAAGAGARAETAAVAHASVTLSRHVRTSIGANGGVRARGILAGSQAGVANQRAAARPPQPAVGQAASHVVVAHVARAAFGRGGARGNAVGAAVREGNAGRSGRTGGERALERAGAPRPGNGSGSTTLGDTQAAYALGIEGAGRTQRRGSRRRRRRHANPGTRVAHKRRPTAPPLPAVPSSCPTVVPCACTSLSARWWARTASSAAR